MIGTTSKKAILEKLKDFKVDDSYQSLFSKDKVLSELDTLCLSYMCKLTNEVYLEKGITDIGAILKTLEKTPLAKLVNFFITILHKNNFISISIASSISLTDKVKNVSTDELDAKFKTLSPEYSGILDLIKYSYANYPKVLSGEKAGLNVLFPDGTHSFTHEKLNLQSAIFSNAGSLKSVIIEVLQALRKEIKIIEVGGGAGEFTWSILEKLGYTPCEYMFTDIGRAFIISAKKKAANLQYNFMKFHVYDITKQPEQDFFEQYDTVLAYNVVHATKNISESLKNIRSLLKPKGVLILIEVYAPFLWQHFVWGMLEGMWYFDDKYRENTATLALPLWDKALQEAKFEELFVFPQGTQSYNNDTGIMVYQKLD